MDLTRGYEDGRGCRVDYSCRSRGERHLRTSQKDEEMGPLVSDSTGFGLRSTVYRELGGLSISMTSGDADGLHLRFEDKCTDLMTTEWRLSVSAIVRLTLISSQIEMSECWSSSKTTEVCLSCLSVVQLHKIACSGLPSLSNYGRPVHRWRGQAQSAFLQHTNVWPLSQRLGCPQSSQSRPRPGEMDQHVSDSSLGAKRLEAAIQVTRPSVHSPGLFSHCSNKGPSHLGLYGELLLSYSQSTSLVPSQSSIR
jgi:hypothetical protein